MPRRPIPFNGPAYQDISRIMSGQECVNFYLRPYPSISGKKFALVGSPGLESWANLGTSKGIRGLLPTRDFIFAVSGNQFFRVGKDASVTEIGAGTILTDSGQVGIETNDLDVTVVDGDNGYVYDLQAGTLTQITDKDFPGGTHIVYLQGFYFVNRPNTGQIHQSTINNGLDWPGFFDTAGSNIDNIQGLIEINLDVMVVGEQSTEPWRNAGLAGFILTPLGSAFIQQGTPAGFSLGRANNAGYWLGQDKNGQDQVFQVLARQATTVSTPGIAFQISELTNRTDAIGLTYEQAGQTFYVLNFPTDERTFIYDTGNAAWHERSSILTNDAGRTRNGLWRINSHALFDGNHIVGDFENGKLYKMKIDAFDEDGTDIISTRTASILQKDQNDLTINELQILTEPGVGLSTGNAEDVDPHFILSWSTDGGFTFGNEIHVPIGKLGEYTNRAITPPLGQGRNWVLKLKMNVKTKRIIADAFADIEVDNG